MHKTRLGGRSKDPDERSAGEILVKIWWGKLLSSVELLILCFFLDNLTFFNMRADMAGGLVALQYVRNCITELNVFMQRIFTDKFQKFSVTVALKLVFV